MEKGHQGRGNGVNGRMKTRKYGGVWRNGELLEIIALAKGRLGLNCNGQPSVVLKD